MKVNKILTVCENGNIRSACMKYLIVTLYRHKYDVINIGVRNTSKETKKMLYHWADKIFVMDKDLYDEVLFDIPTNKDINQVILTNVGTDIWWDAKNQQLIHKCLKLISTLNL